MEILILMSVVTDTTTRIRLTDEGLPDLKEVQWIINPWDELALTRALELKEDPNNAVDKVTVMHVGTAIHEHVVRKALAMGADEAIRIDAEPMDSWDVASGLAEVLRNRMSDLILAGIESSDYNGGAVGGMVAGLLDISSVSAVSGLQVRGGEITVTRDMDGGRETLRTTGLPLLAVVQKGIAKEPRMPSMRGIMMARKKPVTVIEKKAAEPLITYEKYELPPPKPPCRMVDADKPGVLLDLLENEARVIRLS